MKIKFLSAHHFGKLYAAGDTKDVSDEIGNALIKNGYAQKCDEQTNEQISQTNLETEA